MAFFLVNNACYQAFIPYSLTHYYEMYFKDVINYY